MTNPENLKLRMEEKKEKKNRVKERKEGRKIDCRRVEKAYNHGGNVKVILLFGPKALYGHVM